MNKNLVFLHGFLGNSQEFASLPIQNFNCVTIDLNSAPQYTLKGMAEFVKDKLKNLNISKAHFWGYSMGGRVLLEFYKNYPEVCESLTLESTSPGIMDPQERDNRVQMDSEWARLIETNPQLFLEKWYSQVLFAGFKKQNDYDYQLKLRENSLSARHAQMIKEASPGANPHHFKVIESLNVPTLALVGQNDEKYVQMWGKLIDQNPKIAICNVKLAAIENSGHVIHLENPTGAANTFLKFMKEHYEN